MQFDSLAAALAMDGHGPYVWAVVAISTVVIVGMLLLPTLSSRRFLAEQRRASAAGRTPEQVAAPTVTIEEVHNAPGS